jgi:hypothetical protein
VGGVVGSGGSTPNSGGVSGGAAMPSGGLAGTPVDAGTFPDVTFYFDAGSGTGGLSADSACASASATARLERQPADIIWVIDNSGSMLDEAGAVQQQMNRFATLITTAQIDAHVVVISSPPSVIPFVPPYGVCIPAPLGSGTCPNDTNLPNFLHILQEVSSNDALQVIIDTQPQWLSMIRANSKKTIIVVTDDEANTHTADQFRAIVDGWPGFAGSWSFSGIFCTPTCGTSLFCAGVGNTYQELVDDTGGLASQLCSQMWDPIFTQLGQAVVSGTRLACDFAVPTTNQGIINPDNVSLEFTSAPGAQPVVIGRVQDAGACSTAGGWYYDNPTSPAAILLCPSTCTDAQSAAEPRIEVLFGCLGG